MSRHSVPSRLPAVGRLRAHGHLQQLHRRTIRVPAGQWYQPPSHLYSHAFTPSYNNQLTRAINIPCLTTGVPCTTVASGLTKFNIAHKGVANFPAPSTNVSAFWNGVGYVFALLVIISLLLPLANVIRSLVEEKETKMREVYTPHHTTPYHLSSDTFYHTPSDTSSNTSLSSLTSFYRILSRTIAA